MQKKRILVTGGKGMLAYDFYRTQNEKHDIVLVDRDECDITSFESIMQCIALHQPDILLNCAAYTAVDDAEDIGMRTCFDVNTLGVKNLAKATSVFGVEFITLSTDYVFDGTKSEGYMPTDTPNPIGIYGMSKYLGEQLAIDENPQTVIVRTSWLYGGKSFTEGQNNRITEENNGKSCKTDGVYKNFVNTMLRLSETHSELKVVNDQYGIPTSCVDLAVALSELIDFTVDKDEVGGILHFSNSCEDESITWADFAREIFSLVGKDTKVIDCSSSEYPTKAKRPSFSTLKNTSDILFPHWKDALARYLGK